MFPAPMIWVVPAPLYSRLSMTNPSAAIVMVPFLSCTRDLPPGPSADVTVPPIVRVLADSSTFSPSSNWLIPEMTLPVVLRSIFEVAAVCMTESRTTKGTSKTTLVTGEATSR